MLWFLVLLIPSYALVWPVVHLSEPAYQRVLALNATNYYEVLGERIEFSGRGGKLQFRCYVRPGLEAKLSTRGIHANLVFLLALLLVTPGMRPLNRVTRMALGTLLLFFTHLFFIITKVEITLLTARHPLAGSEAFWQTTDNFLEVTGKGFFPVAIWLTLALPYMLGALDRRPEPAPTGPVGRNAPCTCGSGKKYKYCCGK